jgi:hypothetical protein
VTAFLSDVRLARTIMHVTTNCRLSCEGPVAKRLKLESDNLKCFYSRAGFGVKINAVAFLDRTDHFES